MRSPSPDARSPVVFFANGIGDHVLNLPALRGLAHVFAGRLSLLSLTHWGDLFFAPLPWRDRYEPPFTWRGGKRAFDAADAARRFAGCDLLVSLNPWHSDDVTELLDRLAPAVSVGFFPGFTHVLPLDYGKHTSDLAFDAVHVFDPALRLESFAGPPALPEKDRALARELRGQIPPGASLMTVHSETSTSKAVPRERMIELLDTLLERHTGLYVFVLDRSDTGLDEGRHRDRVIHGTGLPIPLCFAIIEQSDVFLGIDSCMLHASDFFRVPGVGLFATTDVHEFGFRLAPHRHVVFDPQAPELPLAEIAGGLGELLEAARAAGTGA